MESEKKIGIPFREFLNKATNLITVFGIFNALFIFSTSFQRTNAYQLLGIAFFILSVYLWVEIILMAMECSDTTWRYEIFIMFSVGIAVGLVILFYELFKMQVILITIAGLFFILVFPMIHFAIKLSSKRIAKMNETKRKWTFLILIIVAMCTAILILKITSPVLKPVFQKWLESADVKFDTK